MSRPLSLTQMRRFSSRKNSPAHGDVQSTIRGRAAQLGAGRRQAGPDPPLRVQLMKERQLEARRDWFVLNTEKGLI